MKKRCKPETVIKGISQWARWLESADDTQQLRAWLRELRASLRASADGKGSK